MITTTPTVPTVTAHPDEHMPRVWRVLVRGNHAAPVSVPATDRDHAARLSAALRGLLADAYHAGRNDADHDNAAHARAVDAELRDRAERLADAITAADADGDTFTVDTADKQGQRAAYRAAADLIVNTFDIV